jgi:UDP-N-acetylglucosamine acyltransferase
MAVLIADTAWVDPRARIEDGAEIGPFCVVGADATIGAGAILAGHVWVQGSVTIGQKAILRPFSVLGGSPRGRDDASRGGVRIGDEAHVGESAVVHRGREAGETTRVGTGAVLHAGAHVGPDCRVGERASIGSHAVLGAAVLVDADAAIGPAATVHHDVTVGRASFVAAQSRIFHDVPPYMIVDGQPAKVRCLHAVGLRRLGATKAAIESLHEAHRLIYRARMSPSQAADVLASHGHWTPEAAALLAFVSAQQAGRHGRARERGAAGAATREVPA